MLNEKILKWDRLELPVMFIIEVIFLDLSSTMPIGHQLHNRS